MRKSTKRFLSALLCAVLVSTSTNVVFAGTGNGELKAAVKGEEVKVSSDSEQFQDIAGVVSDAAKGVRLGDIRKKKLFSTGAIQLHNLTTGKEIFTSDDASIVSFDVTDPVLSGNSYRGSATPVEISKKGTVFITAAAASADAYGKITKGYSVYFGLYRDAALTQKVDGEGYVSAYDGSEEKTKAFQVPEAGTYYLGVYSMISSSSAAQQYGVAAIARFASGVDRTLSNGKQIVVGQKYAQTNYFKFKAVQTGYITVQSSEAYDKVVLCNSKKTALSAEMNAGYTPTYGVKKGTTYYVKVVARDKSDGGYHLLVKNNAISEKSGTTKAKAVALKKSTTKKGTITAGSSQADWYKLSLTSSKSVTITMKGATNDTLKIDVYQGSRKINSGLNSFRYTSSKLTLKSSGKLSKGTYYIKVYRGNSKSSGWYSLSWK